MVIAADNVVLPWSTWPIVPTFACSLFLSNTLAANDRDARYWNECEFVEISDDDMLCECTKRRHNDGSLLQAAVYYGDENVSWIFFISCDASEIIEFISYNST